MAIASTDGRVMMFADAVFAPRTRTGCQVDCLGVLEIVDNIVANSQQLHYLSKW